MAAVATITETVSAPLDAVLAADLAFHLGDRDGYELAAMEERASAAPAPDETFVGFRIDRRQFFAGEFYKKHCRIGDAGIAVCDGVEIGKKQRRTLAAINREFDRLGRSVPYAFEMRDGRRYDYAAIFGTKKPIPVFQYYRRKGCAAIIHPLLAFHAYPSKHIPKVDDGKPFMEKEAKAVWRGQLSGRVAWAGGYTGFSKVAADGTLSDAEKCAILFDQMPRAAICRRHADNPLVDAGLAMSGPGLQRLACVSAVASLCRERLIIEAQLFYRYLLALDGNDYPSSLYWMLSTNSLVLRQESPWDAFGDCYFQPWVHYVPFARDGGDLVEKIEWCEAHLSQCAGMVANAHRAWSVLFDADYQAERRRAVHAAYRSWFE